jgi:hypothetical protein
VSLWLALIFCAIARHQPALHATSDRSAIAGVASAATAHPAAVTPLSVFRLGTAARPFGWSTTIGDLNTDGTPDLVIADRTSRSAGGYTYQLEFEVSGLEPREISFDSRQDAVTVGVSDVDHDNDLDVVVSVVLSKEIVGIWLNDGTGRFNATDVRQFPSHALLLQTVSPRDLSVDPAALGVPSRRAADALKALAPTLVARSNSRLLNLRPSHLHTALGSPASAPRGPPTPST